MSRHSRERGLALYFDEAEHPWRSAFAFAALARTTAGKGTYPHHVQKSRCGDVPLNIRNNPNP